MAAEGVNQEADGAPKDTVIFSRKQSAFGPDDQDENGGTGNEEAADPRSPGVPDVPRTPAPGSDRKTSKSSPESGGATQQAETVPGLDSPLHNVVHQASSDLQLGDNQEQRVQARPAIFDILCCCYQSAQLHEPDDKAPVLQSPQTQYFPTSVPAHYTAAAEAARAALGDKPILPPLLPVHARQQCLVLDLDETLVHSSFRPVANPDYIIPVQIEDVVHHVYVCKRPGVDSFLIEVAKRFEIVIYTASLNKYADPLLDQLDTSKTITHRLFRESCTYYQGNYVKNLALLGRDLSQCIIVDNSPYSYLFHPDNAIGCTSWIDQKDDTELKTILDFLVCTEHASDVRLHMKHWRQGGSYRHSELTPVNGK